jgi:hypothetical protein
MKGTLFQHAPAVEPETTLDELVIGEGRERYLESQADLRERARYADAYLRFGVTPRNPMLGQFEADPPSEPRAVHVMTEEEFRARLRGE